MSVLIKGMKMPTSCFDCDCAEIYGDGYFHCNRIGETFEEDDFRMARHPDCPIIELPPHGRLIDADELMTKMIEYGWHHPDSTVHEFVEDELHTVIPADKDGET